MNWIWDRGPVAYEVEEEEWKICGDYTTNKNHGQSTSE